MKTPASGGASVKAGSNVRAVGSRRAGSGGSLVARWAMAAILLLIILVFSLLESDTFFTYQNLVTILAVQAVGAILAVAMVFPLVAGEFDLSVGAILGLTHVVLVRLAVAGVPIGVCILVSVVVGMFIGVINAFLVTRIRINALIVTLGMATLLQGGVQAATGGRSITAGIPESVAAIARTTFLKMPMPVFYMIAIGIVAWYVLERTPFGRYMYAVGGSKDAARLAGIRATRLTVIAFMVSGTLAGLAGVITASRVGAAHPTIGPEFLLPAFAAAFLGAAAIKPGTYNIAGTLLAVFTLGTGVTGLQLMGAPFYITPLFNGAALILAVSLTRYLQREAL